MEKATRKTEEKEKKEKKEKTENKEKWKWRDLRRITLYEHSPEPVLDATIERFDLSEWFRSCKNIRPALLGYGSQGTDDQLGSLNGRMCLGIAAVATSGRKWPLWQP